MDTILISVLALVFTLLLFFKASSSSRPHRTSATTTARSGQCKTVLVVDDDPVTRKVLSGHLKTLGFAVKEVAEGAMAVREYETGKNKYCMVVMDYEMEPDMNGIETIKRIRQFDKEVLIVGSTIHDPATMQAEFLSAGANLVDVKPISISSLRDVMQEYNLY